VPLAMLAWDRAGYEATGSIRVPFIAHGLFNLKHLLILLSGERSRDMTPSLRTPRQSSRSHGERQLIASIRHGWPGVAGRAFGIVTIARSFRDQHHNCHHRPGHLGPAFDAKVPARAAAPSS